MDQVEAVIDAVGQHNGHADWPSIRGYLMKYPSEGSNFAPPAPQVREFPRRCVQCRQCWVSDRNFELEHLTRCSGTYSLEEKDMTSKAINWGLPRRVWCEIDLSCRRLQWHCDNNEQGDDILHSVALADIAQVEILETPVNSFKILTHDSRTIVFQSEDIESKLNAVEWKTQLQQLCTLPDPVTPSDHSINDLFQEISTFLNETSRFPPNFILSVLQNKSHPWSLCDDKDNSFLHVAIRLSLQSTSASLIAALLELGVDGNHQNCLKESPLLLAAASGCLVTASALLAWPQLQLDLPCALGATAVHAAANAGDVKMLQLLCTAGIDPERRDENGWTVFHYAAACSSGRQALEFLCELLSDDWINTTCHQGNTALHVAAGCGYLENVRTLLETAANPHIANLVGECPYILALRNHHIQCAVAINEYQTLSPSERFYKRRCIYDAITDESTWSNPLREKNTECTGQLLPLCLIPMVSFLTSLDDPTAAAKYDASRRRERKQRKQRRAKQSISKY